MPKTVFEDQRRFMLAGDQTVSEFNPDQYSMYVDLIDEERTELQEAIDAGDRVEQLDALIDILVVTLGALHSLGVDAPGAWHEVVKTNNAKIDPVTGKVRKRADGKILKPEGWKSPQLAQFVR